MIEELDVVKVVNCPVNFPEYWDKIGTVVCTYPKHPDYYLVEFTNNELHNLHKNYLEVTWILDETSQHC